MPQIRFIAPLVEYGSVQFLRGQAFDLPDELAAHFIATGEAMPVPKPEFAVAKPRETAVQRPTQPKTSRKGRR